MLGTQHHENGIPLHWLPSARDLDPTIRSGAHQFAVAVDTKLQFEALPKKIQHNIHRHRSVLILDIGAGATPPAFDRALLERYHNVDADCEIQGTVYIP
jgi:hypothetical protein